MSPLFQSSSSVATQHVADLEIVGVFQSRKTKFYWMFQCFIAYHFLQQCYLYTILFWKCFAAVLHKII